MQVIECSESDAERWDAFVETSKDATFFHQYRWRDVLENGLAHRTFYLAAESDGRIVGILPLVHIKSWLFGNILSSLAFSSAAATISVSSDVTLVLERAAVELGQRLVVDVVEYRRPLPGGRDLELKRLYETFDKSIEPEPESNMRAIRSKQRNIVRKGIKNGLTSRESDLDSFYRVYAESVHNLGTPVFPKRLFSEIRKAFPTQAEFFGAYKGNELLSCAMNFYFRESVCPYYWGGTEAARRLKGNDFLAWEIMCRASARGFNNFDFGRSKRGTGAYQWKINLGFNPRPLYYEYELVKAAQIPDLNPLNPKYRFFVAAWRMLPRPVATLIGPTISRYLG